MIIIAHYCTIKLEFYCVNSTLSFISYPKKFVFMCPYCRCYLSGTSDNWWRFEKNHEHFSSLLILSTLVKLLLVFT